MLQVKLRGPNGQTPTRGSALAAGYDLYSAETTCIPPNTRKLISTELSITLPPGTYGRIAPRSGMSVKNIDVGAGVIDADYTGEIKVLLINNGECEYEIKSGNRIAQLILEKHAIADVCVVEFIESSERGEQGFGSSGS